MCIFFLGVFSIQWKFAAHFIPTSHIHTHTNPPSHQAVNDSSRRHVWCTSGCSRRAEEWGAGPRAVSPHKIKTMKLKMSGGGAKWADTFSIPGGLSAHGPACRAFRPSSDWSHACQRSLDEVVLSQLCRGCLQLREPQSNLTTHSINRKTRLRYWSHTSLQTCKLTRKYPHLTLHSVYMNLSLLWFALLALVVLSLMNSPRCRSAFFWHIVPIMIQCHDITAMPW